MAQVQLSWLWLAVAAVGLFSPLFIATHKNARNDVLRHTSPSCWSCAQPSTQQGVEPSSKLAISNLKTQHNRQSDKSGSPSKTAEVPIMRTASGVVEINVTLTTPLTDLVLPFVIRTAEDLDTSLATQLFCDSRMFCSPPSSATTPPSFCGQSQPLSPQHSLDLLNACRARLSLNKCVLDGSTIPPACLQVKLDISLGNKDSALTLANVTLDIALSHSHLLDPSFGISAEGCLNLGFADYILSSNMFVNNPWKDLVLDQFAGLLSFVMNKDGSGWLQAGIGGDDLVWSVRSPVSRPVRLSAPLFHVTMCGTPLLANVSSHWPAVFSMAHSCLILPHHLFAMVMTWLPSDCPSSSEILACMALAHSSPQHTRPCMRECAANNSSSSGSLSSPVPSTDSYVFPPPTEYSPCYRCCGRCRAQGVSLPSLVFRLSETGPQLAVPLSTLLLDDHNTLCIEDRGQSQLYFDQALQRIVVGNLVWQSLHRLAVELTHNRVGLPLATSAVPESSNADANTIIISNTDGDDNIISNNASCAVRVQCVGDQQYQASTNTCRDPPCEAYYRQYLNPHTRSCQLRPGFKIGVVAVVVVLALLELAVFEARYKITRVIQTLQPL